MLNGLNIQPVPHYGIDLWFRKTSTEDFQGNAALYLLTDTDYTNINYAFPWKTDLGTHRVLLKGVIKD